MDCWRRVLHDAGSEQFDCATARRILVEALCLPQSDFCPDTQLASLEIDSLILESIALHAEEISGREVDRADICALATVRDLEQLLSAAQPRHASWSSS
jgi:acyl carrier protein